MRTILLVEDHPMNRDMLSRRLERRGFRVLLAADGRHAIEAALAQKPDLILMDLSLPELDGWEATRRLKREEASRHIPVIALTAHAMAGDRTAALAAGCDEFETKPVDLPRLMEKIHSFLGEVQP